MVRFKDVHVKEKNMNRHELDHELVINYFVRKFVLMGEAT